MSLSNSLQAAVYARLTGYAPLTSLIGDRVFDPAPLEAEMPYISFGPSDYVPDDYDCITGRTETLQIDVWSTALDGQRECKAITDLVHRALHNHVPALVTGAVVNIEVTLVQVFRDRDGVTTRGVVQIEALLEDA
jgi:hypothetical protein